jgi:hypothetical protein
MATYQLISSDSHIIEPADLWQERIDHPFRDRAPQLVHEAEADQWFCQVVEAAMLIRQAGASPRSYPPFRRPAPSLSLQPNSPIASASLDDSRLRTTDAVAVESVG